MISARVHGYVLAGGASSRFGVDKAVAELGGRAMLARMCDVVAQVAESVSVVAPAGRYEEFGVHTVSEPWPGQGPLGGIIGALMDAEENHRNSWCVIVGCDMPFLTHDWLSYLIERALVSEAEVDVAQSAHGLEPLCACWQTSSLATLVLAFEKGTRKVTEAMKLLRMEVLDETHWKRFDIGGRLFWNMNTPKDYEDAARIVESERA